MAQLGLLTCQNVVYVCMNDGLTKLEITVYILMLESFDNAGIFRRLMICIPECKHFIARKEHITEICPIV